MFARTLALLALLAPSLALAEGDAPDDGPALDLPEKDPADEWLLRGMQQDRQSRPGTTLGGYGQLNANWEKVGPDGPVEGEASVRRLVVFLAHQFDERFRVYTELEWENAIAGDGNAGAVEVEQAFVDWKLVDETLQLRAGLLLVPMGIVNQWHEPSVFHGVERPLVDQVIIPTTWRELGAGIFGESGIFRYEAYVVTAPDPTRLSRDGFASARGLGALAKADGPAFAGRVEAEPLLGLVFGASAFLGDMGGNGLFYDADGDRVRLNLPIAGWAADARYRQHGWELRAMFTQFHMPENGTLLEVRNEDGSPIFADPQGAGVPATRMDGGYVEVAYDVLRLFADTHQQLLPFVRMEMANTQAAMPAGWKADPRFNLNIGTFGLTYRPIAQVVFKTDLQLVDRERGDDAWLANAGVGFMF